MSRTETRKALIFVNIAPESSAQCVFEKRMHEAEWASVEDHAGWFVAEFPEGASDETILQVAEDAVTASAECSGIFDSWDGLCMLNGSSDSDFQLQTREDCDRKSA